MENQSQQIQVNPCNIHYKKGNMLLVLAPKKMSSILGYTYLLTYLPGTNTV
jgi:hypothetical protein